MIIDSETKRKLREMNAAELLDAFERLDERTVMPLNHAEVVGLAVCLWSNKRVQRHHQI